jgi:hypothetical protein
MDPLSIIAGVAGTVAVAGHYARELVEILHHIRDAPIEVTAITKQVINLADLLRTLDKFSQSNQLQEDLAKSLTNSIEGCRSTLKRTHDRLVPYIRTTGVEGQYSKWSRFRWSIARPETKDLRDELEKSIVSLNIAVSTTTLIQSKHGELLIRGDIAEIQQQIASREENKIALLSIKNRKGSYSMQTEAHLPLQKFLDSLPPVDYIWDSETADETTTDVDIL